MTPVWRSAEGRRIVLDRYQTMLAHWPGGAEHLRLETGQGETFILACGPADAPPLVLLHGSGANALSWWGDAPVWARTRRVYAVDLIGEPGLSAPSRPPLGSEAYAVWLDQVLAGLGLSKAAFVGMSLGGWMALDYATRRPERVERLALLCPAGLARLRRLSLRSLVLLMMGSWGRQKLMRRVLGASPSANPILAYTALVFEHFRPRIRPPPLFGDQALARLTMPVLAVLGAQDTVVDSEASRRRLEGRAEVLWLPETGHLILGQAERVAAFLDG